MANENRIALLSDGGSLEIEVLDGASLPSLKQVSTSYGPATIVLAEGTKKGTSASMSNLKRARAVKVILDKKPVVPVRHGMDKVELTKPDVAVKTASPIDDVVFHATEVEGVPVS